MEQINANTSNIFVLYFVAFVVGTYIGILTARWIGNPIMQLSLATKKIAFRWGLRTETECADGVGKIAKSFGSKILELQESFAALETKNTDLQMLNAALLASESRLYQFLEAMPMGVFIIEAHGKPYYINQIGKQILFSDSVPEVRVENLAQLYQIYIAGAEQLYSSDRLPITKALLGETSSVDDIEIRNRDRIIPIEVTGVPIYDESGEISAIAAFTDISQRKQQQQLRAQYNRTLETQALSNFDLIRLLDNLQQMLHLRASAKNLTLTFEYQPGMERDIETDASKLRQVLLNLLGNTIEFTQTGSVILPVSKEVIYNAAASCSDDLIFELLQQIPDNYAPIIRVFRDLAKNYEFEKIMELTRADAG